MNIHFDGVDNAVYMKKIGHTKDLELEKREHEFWESSIKQHKQDTGPFSKQQFDLWS